MKRKKKVAKKPIVKDKKPRPKFRKNVGRRHVDRVEHVNKTTGLATPTRPPVPADPPPGPGLAPPTGPPPPAANVIVVEPHPPGHVPKATLAERRAEVETIRQRNFENSQAADRRDPLRLTRPFRG